MTKNNGRFLSTSIVLLTFAHLFNDFYAGFLIPLCQRRINSTNVLTVTLCLSKEPYNYMYFYMAFYADNVIIFE